ncbi:DoxX family membrane protein [Streptomyces clavuligerus]|uniref:DoxX family protein n=1 Tax=Streptomyces clavuligerus TaxID=1901 RepID=UPI000810EA63|nr:DoxX family membrane protein [Streptomyces clavuligerus]ANW17084.1 DoxX family protein [Streptomyces clavuligerus]AXU11620.1 DoxX family membrane protein [Streptomyces clavuligerus]MBY6301452.1 DoxX family membrane protein [Streptomyces clavuligerus]QPL61740.1 DoxX family membrane protein [Streptomyces clavuligerus]QPL67773.1 DoxX family membrane protein [Streptomyces clavuligerus]
MDVLVLIGRILFVLLFLNSAIGHLTKVGPMAGYAGAKGVPAPAVAVVGSGLLLLAGSLSVLLGVWADLGALLLAVFLFPTALQMHGFWTVQDPAERQSEMIHFLKDVALGGACLMLLAFFSYAGHDLGLTLTGPLFRIG